MSCFACSSYPEKRVKTDGDGVSEGVVGSLDMLQNATITTQPISSFDWNADKVSHLMYLYTWS